MLRILLLLSTRRMRVCDLSPAAPPQLPINPNLNARAVPCRVLRRRALQGMTQLAWGMVRLGASPSPAFVQLLTGHAAERLQLNPLPGSGHVGQGEQEEEEGVQEEGRRGGRGRGRRGRPLLHYRAMDLSTLMYVLGSWGLRPEERLTKRLVAAVQVGACGGDGVYGGCRGMRRGDVDTAPGCEGVRRAV